MSFTILIGKSGVVEKFICMDDNITWTIAWAKVNKEDMVVWVCLDWDPGPDKLKIQDVGLGFICVRGYIKPAGKLGMDPEEETDYERNLMDGKVPEVTTRGYATSPKRVELAEEPPPLGCAALVKDWVSLIKFSFPKGGVELSRLLSEWRLVNKMINFTGKEYATSVLSVIFEKTSLVEDVADLGMREKQLNAAANITAQVLTSRLENYEMAERHLARVKMKMVDTVLKVMVVVEMYEKANTGGCGVLSRTQLELENVLGLEPQV
jgi:hypothetical protein